jgi:hypothetical protein
MNSALSITFAARPPWHAGPVAVMMAIVHSKIRASMAAVHFSVETTQVAQPINFAI